MIYVHTLGTARIDAGNARVKPSAAKKFALLLYLAAEPTRRVSRAALHDLLFPELPEKNAGHALRELIYKVRQMGVALDADADGVSLGAEAVRSDYGEVIEAERPDASQLRAIEGGFLPGYAPAHSEAFTEWYDGYRARTTLEVCRAVLREVAQAKAGGDWPHAERAARACLTLDPLNEEATLVLAEVLAIAGAKSQAVRLLDSYANEIGEDSRLLVPAKLLRRRISEQTPLTYQRRADMPFVDRKSEFAELRERLFLARGGSSQCVVLVGEPGIGKSRLTAEFAAAAAVDGAEVRTIYLQPHDVHRPLAALMDMVPLLLDSRGALGCSPSSLSLLRHLCNRGEAADERREEMTSGDLFYQTIAAIGDLIEAVAAECTLVLVIEDVHWLDDTSLSLLGNIVISRHRCRLFLILTARPQSNLRETLSRTDRTRIIDLPRLSDSAIEHLVRATARAAGFSIDDEAADWICAASNGSPLFAATLVSHLASTGTRFDVPPTLRDVLRQRIKALSGGAQTVLTLCCLLARHCSLDRLIAAAEAPTLELMAAVTEIERAGLVRSPEGRLSAPHAIVRDVALEESSNLAIAAGHRRIAILLEEESFGDAWIARTWDSAEHWIAAGDVSKAIDAIGICARNAQSIGRAREAAELLCRAADLAGSEQRRSLLLEATRIAGRAIEYDLVLRYTSALRDEGWTPAHDDVELMEFAARTIWLNDASETVESYRHCLSATDVSSSHRCEAATFLIVFADANADPGLGEEAYAALRTELEKGHTSDSYLRGQLGYHTSFGDWGEVRAIAGKLAALADRSPLHRAAGFRRSAGAGLWRAGDGEGALGLWIRAYEEATRCGLVRTQLELGMLITSSAMDLELATVAEEWNARLAALRSFFPESNQWPQMLVHDADMAAAERDLEALQVLRNSARDLLGTGRTRRVIRWVNALEILVALLSGKPLQTAETVSQLTAEQVRHQETGDSSDFEIATAIRVYAANGDVARARQLLVEYLTNYRKNPSPLWSSLREAAREVGAWDEAAAILQAMRAGASVAA